MGLKGALFLIDECQRIFPPAGRLPISRKLDYPGGPQLANAAGRPETIQTAFWDMHRHHNWDFVLTCPNISQVRNEIKAPAETAIRHVNMAILGLRGFYKSVLHTSDCSGSSPSHSLQTKAFNKVPSRVFKLYDSTVTGPPIRLRVRPFSEILKYWVFFSCWDAVSTGVLSVLSLLRKILRPFRSCFHRSGGCFEWYCFGWRCGYCQCGFWGPYRGFWMTI